MARSFTFIRKGGYDTREVDTYIDNLEKELQSFRMRETMISNAMVDAQLTSKGLIKKAEEEANHIQKDAILQLDSIGRKISYIKRKLETFQSSYNKFIDKFAVSINQDELNKLYQQLEDLQTSLQIKDGEEQSSKPAPVATPTPASGATADPLFGNQNMFNDSAFNQSSSNQQFGLSGMSREFSPETQKATSGQVQPSQTDDSSPFLGMNNYNSNLFTID